MEGNNIKYEFLSGLRRNSVVLYLHEEKQLYVKKYNYKTTDRYTCYVRSCKAGLIFDNLSNTISKICDPVHSHSDQSDMIEKMKLINSMKRDCLDTGLKRKTTSKQIFDEKRIKMQNSAHLVDYRTIKRSLNRIKSSSLPKPPVSFSEIKELFSNENVMLRYGMSGYDNTKTFYKTTITEVDFGYSIFMSTEMCQQIDVLAISERNYFVDGTFNVLPVGEWKQLLIVYIAHAENVYPFLFVLMSEKSENAYKHVFQNIEANLFQFVPNSFTVDFEPALKIGLKKVFPTVEIRGSWFHFCRALNRKALQIPNFLQTIRKERELCKIFNKFFVLPLLNPHHIQGEFETIQRATNGLEIFDGFLEYFRKHWISKDVSMQFSVQKNDFRITSMLEAYNSKWGKLLPKTEAEFFNFIDQLVEEEFNATVDLSSSIDGETWQMFEGLKTNFHHQNKSIESMVVEFENDKITFTDLINQLATI